MSLPWGSHLVLMYSAGAHCLILNKSVAFWRRRRFLPNWPYQMALSGPNNYQMAPKMPNPPILLGLRSSRPSPSAEKLISFVFGTEVPTSQ